jgi:hypothetical protein
MLAGKVRCGFFQELVLHLEFPGFPLKLAQPCPLAHGERRLLAGMVTAVYGNPVAQGAFIDAELFRVFELDRARYIACLRHVISGEAA